jgi:hypothetical protein
MFQQFIGQYCIIRTYSAGVHAGTVSQISDDGKQCVLQNSRNLWYWKVASALSQIANDGVKCPTECKFTQTVQQRALTGVIEILPCTDVAQKCILEVPVWEQ